MVSIVPFLTLMLISGSRQEDSSTDDGSGSEGPGATNDCATEGPTTTTTPIPPYIGPDIFDMNETIVKPSFQPYCVTRDVCNPSCTCRLVENCEILLVNADVRNRILSSINTHRSFVSRCEPQPSSMSQVLYDLQLEELSRCWAAGCTDDFSECFTTPHYNETSQTALELPHNTTMFPELSLDLWDRAIQIWLGVIPYATSEIVNSFPAGDRGLAYHDYAQVLSDRVKHVGCTWARNKTASSLIFVCTYAPRGPLQGEPIYRIGKACSACDTGYLCDYNNPFPLLCKWRG